MAELTRLEALRISAKATFAGAGPGEQMLAEHVIYLADMLEKCGEQRRAAIDALDLLPGVRAIARGADKIDAAKAELQEVIDSREALSRALRAASEN